MANKDLQKSIKTEKGEFELIKGVFSPEDAQDITSYLIQKKVAYHGSRNFSHHIRFGSNDAWSEVRIEELKQSGEELKALIEKAKVEGKTLSIKSNISIELI